jgi:hypothetical protein
MLRWCLGPESNRYGVASEGFSYSPQLSLPSDGRWGRRSLVWSLDFLFVVSRDARSRELDRGRQVSTLSHGHRSHRMAGGLSSGLQARRACAQVRLFPRI